MGARLVGLDIARCLALLAMVAAHVLDQRGPDGRLTLTSMLVDGRSSALFAVLAGVSLALLTRRGSGRGALAVRAILVALIGLALGELGSGLAVILTYYGLLFALGLPFVALRARTLLVLAGLWALLGPALSQLLRPTMPDRGFASPTFAQLTDPGQLLSELFLTGYYPCLPWLAYLLLGLGIGRLDLRERAVAVRLAAIGLCLAVGAVAMSRALVDQPWVLRALLPQSAAYGDVSTAGALVDAIGGGMFGTTPTGASWAWLLVAAPHSGTPFDLLTTGGSAMLVIGLCLLLASWGDPASQRSVAVLFGAGTMTLTLYTLHVVMRTEQVWPPEYGSTYGWHVLVLGGIGAGFVALRRRGPLEVAVGDVSALATRSRDRCP